MAGLATVLAACYSPSAAVGVPCSSTGDCPAGQHCNVLATPPTCEAADAGLADAPPDASLTCGMGAECASATPVCDMVTSTCRGCIADSECGDDVCIEHLGTCVNDTNVLFVAPTGDDAGTCMKASPCKTIGYASTLAANNQRTIAVADGTYSAAVLLRSSITTSMLTISGPDRDPAGVMLTGGVIVESSSKQITIEGVTIQNTGSRGVDNRGTLTLSRVRITGSNNGLVSTNSNTLRVWDSVIEDNAVQGIDVQQTTLEVLRTIVRGNHGGGIDIINAATTIESSIIANNSGLLAPFRQVRYQNLNDKPQIFRFNTVVDSLAASTEAVDCSTPVALESSIFAVEDSLDAVSAVCTATYSLFLEDPAVGTGNIMGDPGFVAAGDFHIGPRSAARDAANPAATSSRDIDGELRPLGAGHDMGADEIP